MNQAISDLLHGVDVKDDSSRIRRGVGCLADRGGLIVDFHYPGHHAEFVPFKNVISDTISNSRKKDIRRGESAETLFQRFPDGPWCWFPSELLAPDSLCMDRQEYAFVEMDWGDQLVREVVSTVVVRPWTGTLNRQAPVAGVEHVPPTVNQPSSVDIDEEADSEETLEQVEIQDSPGAHRQPTNRGTKRTASGDDIPAKKKRHSSTRPGFTSLPRDMVYEVLSLLPAKIQTRYRLVCRGWNTLIPLTHRTWVQIVCSTVFEPNRSPAWKMATAIHKLVTPATRCLVFHAGENISAVEVAVTMLKAKEIKVPIVIVVGYSSQRTDLTPQQEEICGKLFYGKKRVSGSQ